MPNDFFLQLRLVGNRFSDHSIPFNALSGIVRFKDLVVEASRLEYLKHRKDRERVPTGFSRSLELKLTSIKAGSAQLAIGMTSSGNLPLIPDQESYYSLGRDRLIQTIQRAGSSEDAQGAEVSEKMLQHFDKIAASIEDNEAIFLVDPTCDADSNGSAKFTKKVATRLRSATTRNRDTIKNVDIYGSIFEFNQEGNTIRIQVDDGSKVKAPIPSEFLDTSLELFNGYRKGLKACFQGVGRINQAGTILEIKSIMDVSVVRHPQVVHQLNNLRELRDGWLDGEGIAPSHDGITWLESKLNTHFPDDLPPPYLYPTVTGGIQLEWSLESTEVSIEVNLESHSGVWHELNLSSDQDFEKELSLEEAHDWEWITHHMNGLRSVK